MIGAEARGKARRFKAAVAARAARLDATLGRDDVKKLVREFVWRGSEKGRNRAILRLRQHIDPFADFEIARTHGRTLALWSTPVIEDEGIAVNYRLLGPDGVRRGVWSFRVIEHGLQRYFERGGRDLRTTLVEANRAVCRGKLYRRADREIVAAAAPGAFLGRVDPGGLVGSGIFVGRTWLHRDQLSDAQEEALLCSQSPLPPTSAGR